MRTVTITALADTADAAGVFATICDFGRYAELCESVREVTVETATPGTIDSTWAVNFRSGILKWCERDCIDAPNRRIDFVQTAGDFDLFQGSWEVHQLGGTTSIVFRADFDLGMPSLAAIIDPIAERTLRDNMQQILIGLLGTSLTFLDASAPASKAHATPILAGS